MQLAEPHRRAVKTVSDTPLRLRGGCIAGPKSGRWERSRSPKRLPPAPTMATLELDKASGRYRVRFRFRYDGRSFKRSVGTEDRRVAMATLGQVEETLRLLRLGMAEVPPKVDPGAFIVSGARLRRERLPRSPVQSLRDLFGRYQTELPKGAKEERTLVGERLHFRHLLRHLKETTPVAAITMNSMQRYVELRSKDQHRGRLIGPNTIRKEITTFRLVWNWAVKQGYLVDPAPVNGIAYPKLDERPHFMTMAEIERILDRGAVSAERAAELWESLFLTKGEVKSLLGCVRHRSCDPFVYPMFVLVAHTGMRRSELVRAEVSDFDFDSRTVLVREKKRSRTHATSFRRIPMTELVETIFSERVRELPAGHRVLSQTGAPVLTADTIKRHFKMALAGTSWEPVRGFHVLRHSFASNAAAEGVDQRMIDDWMGHQTEQMRRRYRHCKPWLLRRSV